MCVDANSVDYSLCGPEIDHGDFDADAWQGDKLLLVFGEAFFEDKPAHLYYIFCFTFVKIRLVYELDQLGFGCFGDVLWSETMLL
jgi:hypothetical protein